jgi:hypothetical protein
MWYLTEGWWWVAVAKVHKWQGGITKAELKENRGDFSNQKVYIH